MKPFEEHGMLLLPLSRLRTNNATTSRDNAVTSNDNQGQAGTNRDKQWQAGIGIIIIQNYYNYRTNHTLTDIL